MGKIQKKKALLFTTDMRAKSLYFVVNVCEQACTHTLYRSSSR
jgi:hypothetical protein